MVKYLPNNVSDEIDSKLAHAFIQFYHLHRFVGPHDIDKGLSKFYEQKCRKMKFSELRLLFYIRHAVKTTPEGISASELSVIMDVKPPTINPLLADLEKLSLISRKTDTKDRRFVRFDLTPVGLKLVQDHQNIFFKKIHGLACYLGEEKSNTLIELTNDVYMYFSNQCV